MRVRNISGGRRRELLSAELPNAQEWFTERLSEMKATYGEYWNEITADSGNCGDKIDKLSGFVDFGTKKAAEVVIAKIPTENPWEVFAWLPRRLERSVPSLKS